LPRSAEATRIRTKRSFDCQDHAFEDIDVPRLLETKANTIVGFSDDDSTAAEPAPDSIAIEVLFLVGTEIETDARCWASSRH
jgi:hypothetical protein